MKLNSGCCDLADKIACNVRFATQKRTLAAAEDGLYVIALWIEHEARVVTSQVTFSGIAKPWRTDIGSARFRTGRIKLADVGAALGGGRTLLNAAG